MEKDPGRLPFLDSQWLRHAAALSGAVFTKALLIYLGFLAGRWVDTRLHTRPLFMSLFVIAGAGIGLWWILRVADGRKS